MNVPNDFRLRPLLLWRGVVLLTLLFHRAAGAAEQMTVAWHIPYHLTTQLGVKSPRAHKLDGPPGESTFFKPGDALWEVSECLDWGIPEQDLYAPQGREKSPPEMTPKWTGEWVVWNPASHLLIARGTRNEILEMERSAQFSAASTNISSHFELRGMGSPVELAVTSRSTESASLQAHGVKLTVTGEIAANKRWTATHVEANWTEAGEPAPHEWHLDTQVSLPDQDRTLIAKHGPLEIWMTSELRMLDGTPTMRGRWREAVDGSIHPWPGDEEDAQPVVKELGPGQWVAWCRVPRDVDNCCDDRRTPVTLPAAAEAVAHGRFVTLGETPAGRVEAVKAAAGERLDWEGFFAAESEMQSGTLLLLGRQQTVEAVAAAMADPPDATAPTVVEVTATTGPDSDPFILSCDSGAKASIYQDQDKGTKMGLQIEPVVPKEYRDHLDLRYTLDLGLPSCLSSSGAAGLAPGMFFPPLGVGERRVSATWRKLTEE